MKTLLAFLMLLIITQVSAQRDSSLIILQHAVVIDGISKKPLKNKNIVIERGKIVRIEKQKSKYPSGAILINLTNKWILPGFVDAHVHFFSFEAAKHALTNGVTTARTMQCDYFMDLAIRDAHRQGQINLPEVIAAGYQIRPDMPEAFFHDFPELSDLKPRLQGVKNVRRVVKALVSRKVDHIKILATERAGTPNTNPQKRTFTDEELIAIVDEANNAGLKVAAHSYTDEATLAALQAGVKSIEHGSFLSDKTLKMMKSNEIYFSPTFSFWNEASTKSLYKENLVLAERLNTIPSLGKIVTISAFKIGVQIVTGTDITYSVPGISISHEAIQLHKIGIPAMEVIKSMTSKAAHCLNVNGHTGSIKSGLDADLVIVEENPLKNLEALLDIKMVINNGRIVFNRLQ